MSKRRVERGLAGAALLFAALGDPTRLALLQQLSAGGPASISMLAETVSHDDAAGRHQASARPCRRRVIDGSRLGREQVWTVNPTRLEDGRRCLEVIARGWDDALARLKLHVEGS